MAIKVGAQLYTLRNFMQTPEDIEKTLTRVKQMGFDVVQLSGHGEIDPHRLADIVHSLGLDVCITHIPYDRLVNDLDNVIAEHRLLHCDAVGLGGMPVEFRGSAAGAKAFMAAMQPVVEKLTANGMKFGYHNHNFEFEKFDGRRVIDMLIEDTSRNFGFIQDTYWVQAGGGDPAAYVRRVAGRMKVIHFKDMAIYGGKQEFAPVGEGNLDFRPVIGALRDTGVEYIVIEQDECRSDPFDCLAVSKKNIEAMLEA